MKKTVLITGCSTGFGKLTAKLFQKNGWNVIATMRSPEKENDLTQLDNILVSRLDVTDNDSIAETINSGLKRFGTIDALVNNAGYGGHAFLEQFKEEQIYTMFETNVFGVIRLCRAVLPVMRKQRGGTIVNVTSMAGHMGLPLSSTYVSSKFAVEGLTQSLAMEYKPFNIRVKAVAPGAFGTNFNTSTDNSIDNSPEELIPAAHKTVAHFASLIEQMTNQSGKVADPQEVADIIYNCVINDTPVHNIVGADAEMLMGMKNSMSSQDFINQLVKMLTPQDS